MWIERWTDPSALFRSNIFLIIQNAYKFLPKKRRLHEEEMEDIKQIMAVKPNKKLSTNISKRQLTLRGISNVSA